jgi:hypothetical protein
LPSFRRAFAWRDSDNEKALNDRLDLWAKRTDLKETSAESAFIDVFFRETWGYVQTGQRGSETGFSLYPKFAIPGAGANGGSGEADLAIGHFGKTARGQFPQVLCEFKGIRSALDADQKRKGNTRSPVRQCLDYLGFARHGMIGSGPILPTRGMVTEAEGTFILAQWRVLATTFSITERTAGKKPCAALRKLATTVPRGRADYGPRT